MLVRLSNPPSWTHADPEIGDKAPPDEPSSDARDDHEDRECEAQRRELAIAHPPDEPHVGEGLRHHREDAEQHGHGHVDQLSADRSLGQARLRCRHVRFRVCGWRGPVGVRFTMTEAPACCNE